MRFQAQYKNIKLTAGNRPDYWRTVDADTLSEADKLARRMSRKGYRLHFLTQEQGRD
jgi:hypothetical protein